MRLRILATLIVTLIIAYVFFWHYMAGEVEARFESWTHQQKKRGVTVTYEALDISGFPYRMELSLTGVNMVRRGDNAPHLRLTTPKITLIAFPWKINHAVMVSAGGKIRLGQRGQAEFTLTFGKSRASAQIGFDKRRLQRLSLISEDINWKTSTKAVFLSARDIKFHMARPDVAPESDTMELPPQMKLYLEANDVIARNLPPESPMGIFGKKADQVKIDLTLHGKTLPEYNRDSLIRWRDEGGTLAVEMLDISSGEMDLSLDGETSLDQDLKPLGAFRAKIQGIDHIVTILSGHSAFQIEPGRLILEELKQMSREKDSLDLAISLQNGLLFLGPIPVYELESVVQ